MLGHPVAALREGFDREMLEVVAAALDILLRSRNTVAVAEQQQQRPFQDDIHSWGRAENDEKEDMRLQDIHPDRQVLEDSHVLAVVLPHTDFVEDHHDLDKEGIQEVDRKMLKGEEDLCSLPSHDEVRVPFPYDVAAVVPEEMTANGRLESNVSGLCSVKVDDPFLIAVLLVVIRLKWVQWTCFGRCNQSINPKIKETDYLLFLFSGRCVFLFCLLMARQG
jgi:hypothetical protein